MQYTVKTISFIKSQLGIIYYFLSCFLQIFLSEANFVINILS